MPYIKQSTRDKISYHRYFTGNDPAPKNPGELNYFITKLILSYKEDEEWNYQMINDVLGALEGAKLEFYRRLAVPYEDKKINENGDVY